MAYTTTATRGVAPDSLNLNIFGHMPKPPKFYGPDASLSMPPSYVAASPVTSDDEDMFNLDMVTMNMDFEQAYTMYNKLQKKNVMLQVDQLRKAQELSASKARTQQFVNSQSLHTLCPQQLSMPAAEQARNIPSSVLGGAIAMPQIVPEAASQDHRLDSKGVPELYKDDTDHGLDQFFSHTESDAIERFLDDLAGENPQQNDTTGGLIAMQPWYDSGIPQDFFSSQISANAVKKEITDAFQHPAVSSLRSFGSLMKQPEEHPMVAVQQNSKSFEQAVPSMRRNIERSVSPTDTKASKRSFESESSSSPDQSAKRCKVSTKSLLSTEQKRLNHSLLEQKRRLLCREAYERCLQLVIDVEEYKREMAHASLPSSKRKSSRKQLLKNGLPNLSKHTSLVKISSEIGKLKGQNDQLRALLAGR